MAAPAIEYQRHLIEQCTDHIHYEPDRDGSRTAPRADFCCAGASASDDCGSDTVGDDDNSCIQSQRSRMFIAATGQVWSMDARGAAFACRAIVSGADYTAGLKTLLMNRYGLDETSAFFLGKEAMYSVSSGGYIGTGGNADGPHPLCNDFIP